MAGKIPVQNYFQLPSSESARIRACLNFSSRSASVLDPCAGDGSALVALTDGANVARYAIEIDSYRAESCVNKGIVTIRGDVHETVGRSSQVSLLYLNPGYFADGRPTFTEGSEVSVFDHTYRWLVPGGVLVCVSTVNSVTALYGILADKFTSIKVFRLAPIATPGTRAVSPVVVFAVRKDKKPRRTVESDLYTLRNMREWNISGFPSPGTLKYDVPASNPASFIYHGINFDDLDEILPRSQAWQQGRKVVLPEVQIASGRPLVPLHQGHIGLLCTSGLMNGIFGKGADRHIAQWKTAKASTKVYDGMDDDGIETTRIVQRFEYGLSIVYEDGTLQRLGTEAPEGDLPIAAPAPAASTAPSSSPSVPEPFNPDKRLQMLQNKLFTPGRLHMTDSIRPLVLRGLDPVQLVEAHLLGDWEDTPAPTVASNDAVIEDGNGSVVSEYQNGLSPEGKLLVVTRMSPRQTTIMLPSER